MSGLLLARLMGQYCFAGWLLSSSVVVRNAAGGRAGRARGAVGQPTLHGGPVRLRPVALLYLEKCSAERLNIIV